MIEAARRGSEEESVEGLAKGRIVHYVLAKEDIGEMSQMEGEHYAAMVTHVSTLEGNVHLAVFTSKNFPNFELERVPYLERPTPGTWHWIERA